MAQAQRGDLVQVHYTGRLADGSVFDTSTDGDPLEFRIGDSGILPGFEEAVVGMEVGTTRTTTIAADEAYGPYRADRVLTIAREEVPASLELAVGQRLQLREAGRPPVTVRVTDVSPTSVTLDANHPLAGQDLTFEIELVAIL